MECHATEKPRPKKKENIFENLVLYNNIKSYREENQKKRKYASNSIPKIRFSQAIPEAMQGPKDNTRY